MQVVMINSHDRTVDFDSSKVTALLVNPSAWLWWGTGQVLVKIW